MYKKLHVILKHQTDDYNHNPIKSTYWGGQTPPAISVWDLGLGIFQKSWYFGSVILDGGYLGLGGLLFEVET